MSKLTKVSKVSKPFKNAVTGHSNNTGESKQSAPAESISNHTLVASKNIIYDDEVPQRIDNFLFQTLKHYHLPKSIVYKWLRSGQIRVNKKRIDQTYKLQLNDVLRIPPFTLDSVVEQNIAHKQNALEQNNYTRQTLPKIFKQIDILFEDEYLLVINKPSGMAVHGGSGINLGVIEYLRQSRSEPKLELVHRIDKETSGILLIAKKRQALLNLQEQIRQHQCKKFYQAVIWQHQTIDKALQLNAPLKKMTKANGEKHVFVHQDGQQSLTIIQQSIAKYWHDLPVSLLNIQLKTGRTHQIRVHLTHAGYTLIGDEKYGNFTLNKQLSHYAGYRMFLHAACFICMHPIHQTPLKIEAPWVWSD